MATLYKKMLQEGQGGVCACNIWWCTPYLMLPRPTTPSLGLTELSNDSLTAQFTVTLHKFIHTEFA